MTSRTEVISVTSILTFFYSGLKLKIETGVQIAYRDLNNGLNNLSATGNFDRISYNIENKNGNKSLILNVEETPNKTQLRFAAHYDDLYRTAALINLTHKIINLI